MKRFMIVIIAAGVLGLVAFYGVWNYGFYIDMDPNAPVESAAFTIDGTRILKKVDGRISDKRCRDFRQYARTCRI